MDLYHFDYEYYISKYKDLKDLKDSGIIKNKSDAIKHYKNHGKNEGRIFNNYTNIKWEKIFKDKNIVVEYFF